MKDGLFPWSNFFLNQLTKLLGPSLGVNRKCTKRDDCVPKGDCANFFKKNMPKKDRFEKKKVMFDHSLVFSWVSLVFTSC
jgi:hypothetical protein